MKEQFEDFKSMHIDRQWERTKIRSMNNYLEPIFNMKL